MMAAAHGEALCFNPRHAIRAKKGNDTVELLICFECGQIQIRSPWATNYLEITPDPAPTFNKVLKQAGVPLPKNLKFCADYRDIF